MVMWFSPQCWRGSIATTFNHPMLSLSAHPTLSYYHIGIKSTSVRHCAPCCGAGGTTWRRMVRRVWLGDNSPSHIHTSTHSRIYSSTHVHHILQTIVSLPHPHLSSSPSPRTLNTLKHCNGPTATASVIVVQSTVVHSDGGVRTAWI